MKRVQYEETYPIKHLWPGLLIAAGSALVLAGAYQASMANRPRISARSDEWPEDEDWFEEYDQHDTVPEELEPPAGEFETTVAPDVTTLLDLPRDGLYGYRTPERRYGTRQTIEALKEIGSTWNRRHSGLSIGIGDVSKSGGGTISGHRSHKRGVDVDVRPIRGDGASKPVTYRDPAYSRELTQELVEVIRGNSTVQVTNIFFNDSRVRGVQTWPHHDDHLHVRFKLIA